jgi:hypothetical protein
VDLDITAKTDIRNDGFAKRISGVSNDRLFRHPPPQTIDWNPISSRSHVVLRAMPIGNVAAGNASRAAHALEPSANVVRDIFKLSVINRVSRSGEEGQRHEYGFSMGELGESGTEARTALDPPVAIEREYV